VDAATGRTAAAATTTPSTTPAIEATAGTDATSNSFSALPIAGGSKHATATPKKCAWVFTTHTTDEVDALRISR
jgi:hypothetical protein